MKRFSWINLIPVLIHPKYWNYKIPSLELPCLAHHLCQISFCPTESLFNPILIMFFIGFSIWFYSIWPHTTSIEYTKPYAKLSYSNLLSNYIQIIKTYASNTQPIKNVSL